MPRCMAIFIDPIESDIDFWLNRAKALRTTIDIVNYQDLFRKFLSHLIAPTYSCQEFTKIQSEGGLTDYIGTQMIKGGSGGNGGIRPCLRISL